jgi:hypothetical protein
MQQTIDIDDIPCDKRAVSRPPKGTDERIAEGGHMACVRRLRDRANEIKTRKPLTRRAFGGRAAASTSRIRRIDILLLVQKQVRKGVLRLAF